MSIKISFILMLAVFLPGCNTIKLSHDIYKKRIYFDKQLHSYIVNDNIPHELSIIYNNKRCMIWDVIQNDDYTLTAIKIGTNKTNSYFIDGKTLIMPQKFIILINNNKIVYTVEEPFICGMRFDGDVLEIIYSYQIIRINQSGKIISDKRYKRNQLEKPDGISISSTGTPIMARAAS